MKTARVVAPTDADAQELKSPERPLAKALESILSKLDPEDRFVIKQALGGLPVNPTIP
jgi:hypothetical protein